MIILCKESLAKKIFATYRNVAALSLGTNKKGFSENGLEITYDKINFLPDADTLNGFIDGSINFKKYLKKDIKALYNPNTDKQNLVLSAVQMASIVSDTKNANIIVFVTDDIDDTDPDAAIKLRKLKFMKKYIAGIMGEFGLRIVDSPKEIKAIFGFDKKTNKKIEKVLDTDASSMTKKQRKKRKELRKDVEGRVMKTLSKAKKDSGLRISRKGYILKKRLMTFYSIEIRQHSLSNIDYSRIGGNQLRNIAKSLAAVYTNDNLKEIDSMADTKKEANKLAKTLAKKNKRAYKAYQELRDIVNLIGSDDKVWKMFKVKYGYKNGKSANGKPKMDVKDFVDFYTKRKHAPMMAIIFAHTAFKSFDVGPGDKEYEKYMRGIIRNVMGDEAAEVFIKASKDYAKSLAAKPATK